MSGRVRRRGQPYMREHSNVIRIMSKSGHKSVREDSILKIKNKSLRSLLVISCRNRQRQLHCAWYRWLVNAECEMHDYKKDMISVLSRPIFEDEKRTELEIEALFKWAMHSYLLDPTGIPHTLFMCSSKQFVVNALQQCRLEKYGPSEYIVLQNQSAAPEEGLYTILSGKVDIIIFSPDSANLVRLHMAKKNKQDDEVARILKYGSRVAQLNPNAGFGELSAIANVRRAASVCSTKNASTEIFVVTKACLVDLLSKQHSKDTMKDGDDTPSPSAEVMDYLRQSGLAHKTAIFELLQAASCFKKLSCQSGTLLYRKGDFVDRVFLVLGGEFLLDTGEFDASKNQMGLPFQTLDHSKCYILRRGSILGDEGMSGKKRVYQASAVSLSENNIVFEVSGFGLAFLEKRFGLEKYSALAMMEQSPSNNDFSRVLKSEVMVHSTFTCLRRCIASQNPIRGFNHTMTSDEPGDSLSRDAFKTSHLPPLPPSPVSHRGTAHSSRIQTGSTKPPGSSSLSATRSAIQSAVHSKSSEQSASDHYVVLTPAAMHHAKMIVKYIRQRELFIIRQEAKRNVDQAAAALKASKERFKSTSADANDRRVSAALEEKYRRAIEVYKARTNENISQRVFGEDSDLEEEHTNSHHSVLRQQLTLPAEDSTILSYDSSSFDDDDLFSRDDGNSSFSCDSTSRMEKFLTYLQLKRKENSNYPVSPGSCPANSAKSILRSLQSDEFCDSPCPSPNHPDLPTKDSGFFRVSTAHTVGFDSQATEREGNSKRNSSKNAVEYDNDLKNNIPHLESTDSSLASDISLVQKCPKVVHKVGSVDVKSIEDVFGVKNEKMFPTLDQKRHVPEHLWTTRYMKSGNSSVKDKEMDLTCSTSDDEYFSHKSDSTLSYGRSLVLRARQELTNSQTAPADRSQESYCRGSATLNLPHASSGKDETKSDPLESFEMLMAEERATRFLEGRRKNMGVSEYRFNREIDSLKTMDEIVKLNDITSATKDLLIWKNFCNERVAAVNKGNELRTIPVRARSGAHTIYWGKQLIKKSFE